MTSLFHPGLGSDTMTIRDYQLDAFEAVRREFRAGVRRTLAVLPTGAGKSLIASKISRATVEKGGKVLILAHLGDLVHQMADNLERVGIIAGVEKAELYARSAFEPDVVVATVQTMKGKRLANWDPSHFNLVIVDEAHHCIAEMHMDVLKHFCNARVLGITATPDRADKASLMDVFQSVAYEITIWELMTAPAPGPYLSRLVFNQCDVGIDLKSIRTTKGDFNQAELEEIIRPHVDTLANLLRQEVGNRSTLAFTPDVGSAMALATALQSLGMSADWIAGDSPDRDEKTAKYKSGETQIMVNCKLFCEGVDVPRTSAIALFSPTKSRSLYAQKIGRGLRLYPDKENCLAIDPGFLTAKHDLVRPVNLFDDAGISPDVLSKADDAMSGTPGIDLLDAIEKAKREDSEEKEQTRRLIQIQAKERKVKYRKISYDPLAVAGAMGLKFKAPTEARFDPPTGSQLEYARQRGIPNPESMTKRLLSRTLDLDAKRRAMGLASPKQIRVLMSNGVDPKTAREMSIPEASAAIGQILGPVPV